MIRGPGLKDGHLEGFCSASSGDFASLRRLSKEFLHPFFCRLGFGSSSPLGLHPGDRATHSNKTAQAMILVILPYVPGFGSSWPLGLHPGMTQMNKTVQVMILVIPPYRGIPTATR